MNLFRAIIPLSAAALMTLATVAQVENGGTVRKRAERDRKKQTENTGPRVTDRMQGFFESKEPHDADLAYMRQIYRQLDLKKDANTPLYFPEDVIDGQENLFRIILRLVVDGDVPAYEYLDGREVFTDKYKVKVGEMLDRFGIYYNAEGSENNRKYVIDEADVPTGQVLNYYILEKWEFDRRSNQMKTRVEAICPVLNRFGEMGGETKYPMFWVKFDQLRPYLAQQYVFTSDKNNLPTYSLDDYFTLGLYDGEIYKTRNLRNLSMMQMYPDEDMRLRAADSIDHSLREFGKNLWVPSREEYLAMKEKEEEAKAKAEEALAAGDSVPERTVVSDDEEEPTTVRASRRGSTKKRGASASSSKSRKSSASKTKTKKAKVSKPKSSGSNSSAGKSVRRRRR